MGDFMTDREKHKTHKIDMKTARIGGERLPELLLVAPST
jgi:hypothetical protein